MIMKFILIVIYSTESFGKSVKYDDPFLRYAQLLFYLGGAILPNSVVYKLRWCKKIINAMLRTSGTSEHEFSTDSSKLLYKLFILIPILHFLSVV